MLACGILMGCGFIDYERRDTQPSSDAALAPEDRGVRGDSAPAGVPGEGGSGATDAPPPSGLASVEDAWIDDATVALFHFSGAIPLESKASPSLLEALEPDATTTFIDGPFEGVQAVDFSGDSSPFVLADHPMWQLSEGSIDFYLRIQRCATDSDVMTNEAILSRDAVNSALSGHLHINLTDSCRVFARLQSVSSQVEIRSETLSLSEWYHIGLNFGGETASFSVWVNGIEHDTLDWPHGIDGNQNPWVFAGGSHFTSEGSAVGWNAPFTAGAVALLRISSARRDFSRIPLAN